MKYVCVLSTNEYLDGVLVLNQNLKALNSKYELLCLINDSITEETINYLDYFNIEYKKVKNIKYNSGSLVYNWQNTFDKLNVFALTEYTKIVYLDSDLLILENIDNLFQLKHLTMASDKPYHDDIFNSGIMVIEPNIADYNKLIKKMKELDKKNLKNIGDQNIINACFSNINTLDENYNHMRYITKDKNLYYDVYSDTFIFKHNVNISNRISSNPKIIHYIVLPKPFMLKEPFEDEYYFIYKKYLDEVHLKKNKCLINKTKLNIIIDSINYKLDVNKCLKNLNSQTHKNYEILLLTNKTYKKARKNVTIINNNADLKKHLLSAPYTTIINKDIELVNDCFELCLFYLVNYHLDWCQYSINDRFTKNFFQHTNFHNEIIKNPLVTKSFYDKVYKSEMLIFANNIKEIIKISNNIGIIGKKCYKITHLD